ncbi:MAG: PA0069 family radical SAM protein [Bacteroidota bacterium]
MEQYPDYLKGRGAQINPPNPYLKQALETEVEDGLDEPLVPDPQTEFFLEHPKSIVNEVKSPDIPAKWSVNPYQGCEHGCVYCYARNAHEYCGLSAGLDFERKIIVKPDAPALLEQAFRKPNWEVSPIMFSGNTDCYQPIERKMELTRKCLEVFWKYRHPVSLITKNALILRDLDLLQQLASENLVHVHITITTLDETLRRAMEPRTASGKKRLQIVERLNQAGIPTGVMLGPIIPGLNGHEGPALLAATAKAGACSAGYTFIRLNARVGVIFEDWLRKVFPDRADKVLHQIREAHGGQVSDNRFGTRMRGEGPIAEGIAQLFRIHKERHYVGRAFPPYNLTAFRRTNRGQMQLFD